MNSLFGPNRQSIRMKGYDYRSAGVYFVTLCVQDRSELFGHIEQQKMILSPAGEMVTQEWKKLTDHYQNIVLDEFIVMPNHLHGVIIIESNGGWIDGGWTRDGGQTQGLPLRDHGPPLSDMIRRFKSSTTVEYIHGVKQQGWPTFRKRLWQRNYYERIIRNEKELNHVRKYIRDNPLNWETDPENNST